MTDVLGAAFIDIRARTANFDRELQTRTRTAMAGAGAEVNAGSAAVGRTTTTLERDVESKFGRLGKTVGSGMSGALGQARTELGRFAPMMKLAVPAAIAAAGFAAVKMAGDFQQSMTTLVTGAGESEKNLRMVGAGVLHMSTEVGASATDLASGLYMVESAGFHGARGLMVLKAAAEGAKVGAASMGDVANAVTSALNAYHMPATAAASATNTLIATVAAGKMHMQDLATALGSVLPVAAAAHIRFSELGAAMATMTSQGMPASNAATALRFSLMALLNPSSKAVTTMKQVGLSADQVSRTLTHQGLQAALQLITTQIGQKFPASSPAFVRSLANIVGGTRGMQAALTLGGRHAVTFSDNIATINARVHNAGNSIQGWSLIQQNFNQRMSQAKAVIEDVAIRTGNLLIPAVEQVVRAFMGTVNAIAAVIGFFVEHKTVTVVLAGVITALLLPALIRTVAAFGMMVAIKVAEMLYAAAVGADALAASLADLGAAEVVATGGLAAVGAAIGIVAMHFMSGDKAAKASASAVDQWVSSLDVGTSSSASLTSAMDQIRAKQDALRKSFIAAHGDNPVFIKAIQQHGAAYAELGKQLDGLRAKYRTTVANESILARTFGITRGHVESLAQAYGIDLSKPLVTVDREFRAAYRSVQLSHHPLVQAGRDFQSTGDKAVSASDQVTALKNAFDLLAGKSIAADQAAITFRGNIADLTAKLKTSAGSMSLNTAKGRDARDQFDTTAQSALDYAAAVKDSTQSTGKARDVLAQTIKTLQATGGASQHTKDMIAKLKDALSGMHADGVKAGTGLTGGMQWGIVHGKWGPLTAAANLADGVTTVVHSRLRITSPSKVFYDIGANLMRGMKGGIVDLGSTVIDAMAAVADKIASTSVTQRVLDKWQAQFETIQTRLQAQLSSWQQKLSTARQDAGQLSSGITSNLMSSADITSFGTTNPVGIITSLRRGLGQERRLRHALDVLRHRHFAPHLIDQLAGQGLAALPEATALAGASGSALAIIGRDYRQFARGAHAIGQARATAEYGPKIDRLDTKVQQLHHDLHAIHDVLSKIHHEHPAKTGKAVADGLNSTSRHAQNRSRTRVGTTKP